MLQSVVAQTNREANLFQRHLIPHESKWTRFLMQNAGRYARDENPVKARLFSSSLAIVAVASSFFNAISYFIQTPIKLVLNIVKFQPMEMVLDCVGDLTNVVRSLVFVSLGVTFVVAGTLFPHPIFTHFAPVGEESFQKEAELEAEVVRLKAQIAEMEAASTHYQDIATAAKHLKAATEEISTLKRRLGEGEK